MRIVIDTQAATEGPLSPDQVDVKMLDMWNELSAILNGHGFSSTSTTVTVNFGGRQSRYVFD